MIGLDEDALICDLAETYHIFNYRELSPSIVGALACGLRENSRIKMKISGVERSLTDLILAIIADRLGILVCQHSSKATPGDVPPSIYEKLLGIDSGETNNNTMIFTDGAEYEAYRSAILRNIDGE